ncbi:hypothetical protein ASZ90_010040 [hydrocarbon metagenome]|uniref:Uncharacterized protein n=1 Tax=hydrocarbon metagenome TaxID=938273 RepID=A0A0W8FH42_9ZZZZ
MHLYVFFNGLDIQRFGIGQRSGLDEPGGGSSPAEGRCRADVQKRAGRTDAFARCPKRPPASPIGFSITLLLSWMT